MSKWHTAELADIDYEWNKDGDVLNILVDSDYQGNIYVEVKVKDIKKILNEKMQGVRKRIDK